jgi:transposase-like protein
MPVPCYCPNRCCVNHRDPPRGWLIRCGRYLTAAHGSVQRYRCRACRRSLSDQTESMHYYAKRRLPLKAIWLSLLEGASQREIARRYALSCPTVQNAILRLGRQAMASHLELLRQLTPRADLVYDGLRCFVTSQDYPVDLTIVVESQGETILTMTHTVMRRGGTMTAAQRLRMQRKLRVWKPEKGAMKGDISRLIQELWEYVRPTVERPARIHTDEQPLYRALFAKDPVSGHFRLAGLFTHTRTPGSAPRTVANPLFPVNYVDRLVRHRLKEHTRQTIAFGRNATMQMHRAWIFACDHNVKREYRVKKPDRGTHAGQGAVEQRVVAQVQREFFTRRLRVVTTMVPESLRRVWTAQLSTPPVRWKRGQRGTSVVVPAYALAELDAGYQHAS